MADETIPEILRANMGSAVLHLKVDIDVIVINRSSNLLFFCSIIKLFLLLPYLNSLSSSILYVFCSFVLLFLLS